MENPDINERYTEINDPLLPISLTIPTSPLKSLQEKLTESAQKVFAKMYEQTQAAQGAAGAGPDMSGMGGNAQAGASSADDDVVDADFKEV